jgi:hypothetical protein
MAYYLPNLCDKTFLLYKIVVEFERRLASGTLQYF